ncbi:hypothetical protein DFH29DRAFT_982585 [Suillus ampliporus]|nr:hypothetical protein DFH29DRAFT_982585 [Suillus ampliporus]
MSASLLLVTLHVSAYEQAFIMPHGITAISPTSMKFGISTKDIIEMLVQYDAALPDNARLVLSHNYEVANVRRIVTSPSLLESTLLVFVYGLDLFFTRIAPSGTFDLVLTVTGLGIVIMVTKPMVGRKRLRERWYQ